MFRSRTLFHYAVAGIFLAGLIAGCGGQTPTQGEIPSPEDEEPTARPTETESVSPLLPGESPLPMPTKPGLVEIVPPGQEPGSEPAPLTGEVPQDLLDAVIDDLLERLGMSRETIEIEKAEYVIWRDGSLGCPQPGMMYTQALVPGYQIVLRVGGETYDYHASESGYFVLCTGGLSGVVIPPDGDAGATPSE
jgi:hypothetical protein